LRVFDPACRALTGGIASGTRLVKRTAGIDERNSSFAASASAYTSGLLRGALLLAILIIGGGEWPGSAVGISRSPRPAAVITGNVPTAFWTWRAQLTLVSLGLILLPESLPLAQAHATCVDRRPSGRQRSFLWCWY